MPVVSQADEEQHRRARQPARDVRKPRAQHFHLQNRNEQPRGRHLRHVHHNRAAQRRAGFARRAQHAHHRVIQNQKRERENDHPVILQALGERRVILRVQKRPQNRYAQRFAYDRHRAADENRQQNRLLHRARGARPVVLADEPRRQHRRARHQKAHRRVDDVDERVHQPHRRQRAPADAADNGGKNEPDTRCDQVLYDNRCGKGNLPVALQSIHMLSPVRHSAVKLSLLYTSLRLRAIFFYSHRVVISSHSVVCRLGSSCSQAKISSCRCITPCLSHSV